MRISKPQNKLGQAKLDKQNFDKFRETWLPKIHFPSTRWKLIEKLLEENSFDIEEACDDIFLSRPIVEKKKFEKIDELLFYFEDQMSDNATRVPVETKTVYNDLLGFYKSSKFHPDRPLKMRNSCWRRPNFVNFVKSNQVFVCLDAGRAGVESWCQMKPVLSITKL